MPPPAPRPARHSPREVRCTPQGRSRHAPTREGQGISKPTLEPRIAISEQGPTGRLLCSVGRDSGRIRIRRASSSASGRESPDRVQGERCHRMPPLHSGARRPAEAARPGRDHPTHEHGDGFRERERLAQRAESRLPAGTKCHGHTCCGEGIYGKPFAVWRSPPPPPGALVSRVRLGCVCRPRCRPVPALSGALRARDTIIRRR
jgi:hypothetical protein